MHCQSYERSVTLIWKNDSEIIQKLNSTPAALCFNLEKFNFSWKFKAEKERRNFKCEFSSRFTKGFLQRKCVNLYVSFFFQSEVAISYLQWWLNKAALALKSVDLTANVAFGKHTLNR